MSVRHFVALLAPVPLALILAGCGGSPASTVTVTEAAPTLPAPTPTISVTGTPSASPTPAQTETPEVTATPAARFTMPKLVGENLQLAQDILQKEGSYVLDQEDALGLDRIQVLDANWTVCKQSPKAGKKVSVDEVVTLSSVKLTEDCP